MFNTLVTAHPEYDITVVLRDPTASFSGKYPNVKILRGDFDSSDLLRQAAAEADIVVRTPLPSETPTYSGKKLTVKYKITVTQTMNSPSKRSLTA